MITTPNEKRLDLPVMITPKSLEELDIIFSSFYEKIIKFEFEKNNVEYCICEQSLDKEFLAYKNQYTKEASIIFFNKTSVIKNNAYTAISDQTMSHNKPYEFRYTIYYKNLYVFKLCIKCEHESSIRYEANGIDEELKYEIFQKIETWIDKYRVNYLVELWSRFRVIIFFISFFVASILLAAGVSSRKEYSDIVKADMYRVINNETLNSSDMNLLIVGVAKIVSNYQPPHYQIQDHPLTLTACLFMLFSIIALAAPKTTIAYGPSKKWITLWSCWAHTILVLIPTLIIIPIIISYIF